MLVVCLSLDMLLDIGATLITDTKSNMSTVQQQWLLEGAFFAREGGLFP